MSQKLTKALITGGNGNLGRLVGEQLLKRNLDVIKFDIPGTEPSQVSDGESIIIGDIRDTEKLEAILTKHQPDCIYHLASLLSGSSEADIEAAWEINATASFHLLRLAVKHNIKQLFFASTTASYGGNVGDPMPEDAVQWPENIYGATKIAVEKLGVYFKLKHKLDFRCLRFPLVFSPFAPPSAVTAYPSHAFKAACNDETFTFPVSPATGMSSMLLDDVIAGIIRYSMTDAAKLTRHSYSLHGYFVSAQDVVNAIEKRKPGFKSSFVPDPTVDALLTAWPNIIIDDYARADWGWAPEYDFERSADKMIEWFS